MSQGFHLFTANFDFVYGSKLSQAYDKYRKLGYFEQPDPIEDTEEPGKMTTQ